MAADPLQIALEHHRAGRLRQAEAGYRALLAEDPANADAMHWLGVLVLQAGHAQQALEMLRRAAGLRPGDAAFWNNLGQAALQAGRADEAIDALQHSVAADAGRAETLFSLGLALLARHAAGDAEAAVDALNRAAAAGMDSAELHYHLGMAMLAVGRTDEAIAACREALQRKPDYAMAHYQLAMAHRRKDEAKDVRKQLLKAVELEPKLAQAWFALARLDQDAGNLSTAIGLYRRAIKAKPDYPAAHEALGRLLQSMGQQREATESFAQAKQPPATPPPAPPLAEAVAELEQRLTDPNTAALHYILAAQSDIFPPSQVPTSLVAGLFDRYADRFDKHLTGALNYRVPEMLTEALTAIGPEKKLDVLDMGCGTGLCGPLLRPFAATLAGVDLSAGMVEKARSRGVYDRLEVGELVQTMQQRPRSYDLLVAADVLIYLGDLGPTFEAAAGALRPGGLFAFSVEAGAGERYLLNKQTRRFTHAKAYLQHLAAIHGFREEHFQDIIGRYEREQPVASYLVILRLQIA